MLFGEIENIFALSITSSPIKPCFFLCFVYLIVALRLLFYPPTPTPLSPLFLATTIFFFYFFTSWDKSPSKVVLEEHSNRQVMTILRSNDVASLQISIQHGVWMWIPVIQDLSAFYVNAGHSWFLPIFETMEQSILG